MKEKICPMVYGTGKNCMQEKCAWWDSDIHECAVRTIACVLYEFTNRKMNDRERKSVEEGS